jgi:hypothetical protein
MPILNYTTSIKSEKTASEIQRKLVDAGACAVTSEYNDDGILSVITFSFKDNDRLVNFRLPINVEGVYKSLSDSRAPRRLKTYEQASRVAWRIVKDWIEAQVAMIEASQADIIEIFLPYVQDGTGQTLYQAIKKDDFKLLTNERSDK